MDNKTLYYALAGCRDENGRLLNEAEKEILSNISDFSVFTKRSDGSVFGAKELFDKMLVECSLEFIDAVTSKLPSIPKRKTLLEDAMMFDWEFNRPLEIIKLLESKRYKITDEVATHLIQAYGYCCISKEDDPQYSHIVDCTNYLLDKGARINEAAQKGKGFTPLVRTFMEHSPALTRAFIECGADPNTSNLLGETALLFACGKPMISSGTIPENDETVKIVELLLRAGADINYKLGKSQTALYWAKRTKRVRVIEILNAHSINLTNRST